MHGTTGGASALGLSAMWKADQCSSSTSQWGGEGVEWIGGEGMEWIEQDRGRGGLGLRG